MIKDLTLITGNANKAEQIAKYLGIPVGHHKLDLDEIQSFELDEVIEHKVKQAYAILKKPVIVDDVAVVFQALDKLPGPFIKWFKDGPGYSKVCRMMNVFKNRKATAIVGIGFYDGKNLKVFKGEIKGTLSNKPKGTNGFGWDVIVIPNGYKKTRAQMNETDYDATSPRRMALEKLEKYLKNGY